ncbi:hypothetical protein RND81_12G050700 [Saponaria officinalis]|uniref:S-protein homolog n=1 Tax=Saponaria officinalis TaxID=3572 RepID=A0AAW1H5X4_SAPOF
MNSYKKINAFILTLFLLSNVFITSSCSSSIQDNNDVSKVVPNLHFCYSLMPNTLIHIANYLNQGAALTVHCKSKDDDLGTQILDFGRYFEFRFKPNFWGTTLFYCDFSWSGGKQHIDIYKYKRDLHRCCDNCVWNVDNMGMHGINKFTIKSDVEFTWNTTI